MPITRPLFKSIAFPIALTALVACNAERREGPIAISVIGEKQHISEPLTHGYTPAGSVLLSATSQGLVSLDSNGEVTPALAQRWIVVDGGRSYIFRLRRAHWRDGSKVDAREVATRLETRMKSVVKLDPYGALASIAEVKAMTSDVIEIDLTAPDHDFLTMLAQPQLAIARRTGGTGPYRKSMAQGLLTLIPITEPLFDQTNNNDAAILNRELRAERAALAVARFVAGETDLVMGGSLSDLPIAQAAKVNKRSLRFDPVTGLFGLAVIGKNPMLRQGDIRSALAMAIDRDALVSLYGIPSWQTQDVIDIMSRSVPGWRNTPIQERRNQAAAIVDIWKVKNKTKNATISLRPGKGSGRALFDAFLVQQFKAIGVKLTFDSNEPDIELVDEIVPYDGPRWILGRVSCARKVSCDPEGDKLLKRAILSTVPAERADLLDKAGIIFANHGGFIPLASPIRWSLVGPRVTGFQPSHYALHPLQQLVEAKH